MRHSFFRPRLTRRQLVGFGIVTIGLGLAGGAEAHAVIVDSKPKGGEVLVGPNYDFRLRFNSRIDLKRSRLVLVTPDRKERPLTILDGSTEDTLLARATGLAPGAYRLRWQVLAVDGHITRGDINFTARSANA
jgi:copper resistance protein C